MPGRRPKAASRGTLPGVVHDCADGHRLSVLVKKLGLRQASIDILIIEATLTVLIAAAASSLRTSFVRIVSGPTRHLVSMNYHNSIWSKL